MTIENIVSKFSDVGVIVPGANTKVMTRRVFDSLKDLKLVQQMGTGLDGVDLEAAEERGVIVATAGGANAQAVAEHVDPATTSGPGVLVKGGWDRVETP